jgi:hypothetical protein
MYCCYVRVFDLVKAGCDRIITGAVTTGDVASLSYNAVPIETIILLVS